MSVVVLQNLNHETNKHKVISVLNSFETQRDLNSLCYCVMMGLERGEGGHCHALSYIETHHTLYTESIILYVY